MLIELPDAEGTIRETTEGSDFQEIARESEAHEDLVSKEKTISHEVQSAVVVPAFVRTLACPGHR